MKRSAHEAEAAVIGCVLRQPEAINLLSLQRADFGDPRYGAIFSAMLTLAEAGRPIDELTVHAELERAGYNISLPELSRLGMTALTADNVEHYQAIVREQAVGRAVLHVCARLQEQHRLGKLSGSELLDEGLEQLAELDTGRPSATIPIRHLVKDRLKQIGAMVEARLRGEAVVNGVPTGIAKLDSVLSGIPFGLVSIVAARPGMGKSALALGCADAASAAGFGVHVFSLEDPRESYADRAIGQASAIPVKRLRAGLLNQEEFFRLRNGAGALLQRDRWQYEDVSSIKAHEIVRAVRRKKKENNTRLVIVDYLQLLSRPVRYESIHDAHTQNIRILAAAAKADKIAYLVLSQLNRELERRQDKRPQLADLRESGSIEETAKLVLGLYRGSYYGDPQPGIDYEQGEARPTGAEWEGRVDILVLKDMHGETGCVRCQWHGPTTKIT